jgi:hypothetical protein
MSDDDDEDPGPYMTEDALDAARGILFAVLFGIAFWAIVALILWRLFCG